MEIGKDMRVDVYNHGQYLGGYHLDGSSDVRIGRGRKNQIILPHSAVSRHHVNLVRQGKKYLLMDRSTNGTFMDGIKADKVLLEAGAEFNIGPFLLRIVINEPEWERETDVTDTGSKGNIFYGLVGGTEGMKRLFDLIEKVAVTDGTVLIVGETGSGKELVAQAVHDLSSRSSAPFVAINCGAITADLIESELFGHEKGAFTGAIADRKGAFEQAHGGTLFLDEIGELPVNLQPKLLRVLETGEIRKVGSQMSMQVDVRVVAATHRNLKVEADKGSFRADLLYRLFVLPLVVPPLRERGDDIALLATHFLSEMAELSPEAMERLESYPWPGNVRELKNTLERGRILTGGKKIGLDDLVFLDDSSDKNTVFAAGDGMPENFEDIERLYYSRALEKSEGNIRQAARQLGLPKSTFYDRLKKYGLSASKDSDK